MDTRELMISNYFKNVLMRFYNENDDFRSLIDNGITDDWTTYFAIDGIDVEVRFGSARCCFIFYQHNGKEKNEMFEKYVVKVAREWFDNDRIGENERQNENEYTNYLAFKQKGFETYFPETIKAFSVDEIFGYQTRFDSYFYIAERADIDPDRYESLCFRHIDRNLDLYDENIHDYIYYFDDYDEEGNLKEGRYEEAKIDFYDDLPSEEKYFMLCAELGMKVPSEVKDIIYNIRDCHDENIGFTKDDRIVLIDYGWNTLDGNRTIENSEVVA